MPFLFLVSSFDNFDLHNLGCMGLIGNSCMWRPSTREGVFSSLAASIGLARIWWIPHATVVKGWRVVGLIYVDMLGSRRTVLAMSGISTMY